MTLLQFTIKTDVTAAADVIFRYETLYLPSPVQMPQPPQVDESNNSRRCDLSDM